MQTNDSLPEITPNPVHTMGSKKPRARLKAAEGRYLQPILTAMLEEWFPPTNPMEHIRLEEVGTRILPSDASQSRVLYHFVSMTVWQSGILDRGLAPCGSRRQRVVFFSPKPDPAGPGWRAFQDTVVIAVDAAQIHRLGLPIYPRSWNCSQ